MRKAGRCRFWSRNSDMYGSLTRALQTSHPSHGTRAQSVGPAVFGPSTWVHCGNSMMERTLFLSVRCWAGSQEVNVWHTVPEPLGGSHHLTLKVMKGHLVSHGQLPQPRGLRAIRTVLRLSQSSSAEANVGWGRSWGAQGICASSGFSEPQS